MEEKRMYTNYMISKIIIIACVIMVTVAGIGLFVDIQKEIVPESSVLEQIAEKNWASVGGYYTNYRLSDRDRKTVLNVQDVYFAPKYVSKTGEVAENVIVVYERLSETRLKYFLSNGGYYRILDYSGKELLENIKVSAFPSNRGAGIDVVLSFSDKEAAETHVKYVVIGGFSGAINDNKERKLYQINGQH